MERHMNRFITSCVVGAKIDCEKCSRAEPETLKNWQEFYVYNRICLQKESAAKIVWICFWQIWVGKQFLYNNLLLNSWYQRD